MKATEKLISFLISSFPKLELKYSGCFVLFCPHLFDNNLINSSEWFILILQKIVGFNLQRPSMIVQVMNIFRLCNCINKTNNHGRQLGEPNPNERAICAILRFLFLFLFLFIFLFVCFCFCFVAFFGK